MSDKNSKYKTNNNKKQTQTNIPNQKTNTPHKNNQTILAYNKHIYIKRKATNNKLQTQTTQTHTKTTQERNNNKLNTVYIIDGRHTYNAFTKQVYKQTQPHATNQNQLLIYIKQKQHT